MKRYKNFEKNHKNLISKFVESSLSDNGFVKNWSFLSMNLLMDDNGQDIKVRTQELFKDIKDNFNLCIKTIVKSKIIIKPEIDNKNFVFRSLLIDLLSSYINLIKEYDSLQLPINKQLLYLLGLRNYQDYKDYIFSKSQKFTIFALLKNFNSSQQEGEKIKLLPGITLRNIDINKFVKLEEFANFYKVKYSLTFEFKTKKFANLENSYKGNIFYNNFKYPVEEINHKLYKIFTALRLLKDGEIGVSKIIAFGPNPFSELFNINVQSDFNVNYFGKEYQFVPTDDVVKFKTLYEKLDSFLNKDQKNNQIKICISRFNKSYMRDDIADQIIDLVIAMEAITTETKESLRYKVSTQLARLLKKSIKERQEIAKKIKNIYDKRSELLHKGTTNHKCEKELNDARIIVGRAIVKLLELTKKDIDSFENIWEKIIYS